MNTHIGKGVLKSIYGKIYLPSRNGVREKYILPLRRKMYDQYDSSRFKLNLKTLGISKGDSVFVMCSPNKIYLKTGYKVPAHKLLNDILDTIGDEGTIAALAYSKDRSKIFEGEQMFDILKTPTQSGMFSELLRRRTGAVRSLQPLYSIVAYGRKASYYCSGHDVSPHAYDKNSPCYKMAKDGAKYLGVGLGVEAFSPGHMIDDYFKDKYIHEICTEKEPRILNVITKDGKEKKVQCYNRKCIQGLESPRHHFKLMNIPSKSVKGKDGIGLFSMNIWQYLQAGIKLYEAKKITIWNPGIPAWMNRIGWRYVTIKKLLLD